MSTLRLCDEEAMALDTELKDGLRVAKVQVSLTFKDQNGIEYSATRIVKMRVRRSELEGKGGSR